MAQPWKKKKKKKTAIWGAREDQRIRGEPGGILQKSFWERGTATFIRIVHVIVSKGRHSQRFWEL